MIRFYKGERFEVSADRNLTYEEKTRAETAQLDRMVELHDYHESGFRGTFQEWKEAQLDWERNREEECDEPHSGCHSWHPQLGCTASGLLYKPCDSLEHEKCSKCGRESLYRNDAGGASCQNCKG